MASIIFSRQIQFNLHIFEGGAERVYVYIYVFMYVRDYGKNSSSFL
jgi:hypothetical protein